MSVPWRVGQHYQIHVYEGDRPVATFHTAIDAWQAVRDHNAAADLCEAVERADVPAPSQDEPCASCGHYHEPGVLCLSVNRHLDCDCPARGGS